MQPLALDIDYAHEHSGWIDCDLIVDGKHHPLDASGVFPPFLPLLHFIKAVASQRLPAKFIWDEEGHGKPNGTGQETLSQQEHTHL